MFVGPMIPTFKCFISKTKVLALVTTILEQQQAPDTRLYKL